MGSLNKPDPHPLSYLGALLSLYVVNVIFWLTPPSYNNVIYEQPLVGPSAPSDAGYISDPSENCTQG